MARLPLDATPLDIITNCFLCYHQFLAQSVSRRIPSMGGYELQKQFFAQSPRERVLLSFAVPPLTATLLLRFRAGAAAPPESLRTRYRAVQRSLDRRHRIE